MSDGQPAWTLVGFETQLDAWIAIEQPSQDLVLAVLSWLVGRRDDPYQGVRRQQDMPNLWFGTVPGTDEAGTVVTCSYFVEESTRRVQCVVIGTLMRPV